MKNTPENLSIHIKSRLYQKYGHKIAIRIGNSEKYAYDLKDKCVITNFVVYLNDTTHVAAIWDNRYRREMGSKTHCFIWNQRVNTDELSKGYIQIGFRQFKSGQQLIGENVLIMSFDTLMANLDTLPDLLELGFPADNIPEADIQDSEPTIPRGRRMIHAWNRDKKFRYEVLTAYDKQCAVCRCTEEKLLQAAHIKAVADGGDDNPDNGICLCANHHIMLDRQLISIDYQSWSLSDIASSVKDMPWYAMYLQNGGKLLPRKKEK